MLFPPLPVGRSRKPPLGSESGYRSKPTSPFIIVPDITKTCPMFFPWTAEPASNEASST